MFLGVTWDEPLQALTRVDKVFPFLLGFPAVTLLLYPRFAFVVRQASGSRREEFLCMAFLEASARKFGLQFGPVSVTVAVITVPLARLEQRAATT
jgi:hypothetical protein